MRRSILTSLCALLLVAGCKGGDLDVGAGKAPGTGSSGGGTGTGGQAGVVWTGYLENYQLPSGSDAVTMTIVTAADGTVTGNVYLGSLPLLLPPTDPDVGYPTAADAAAASAAVFDPEHFAFTIIGGTLAGERLTFTLQSHEIWAQWCAIQTTIYPLYNMEAEGGADLNDSGIAKYSCLPNGGWLVNGSVCFHDPNGPSADCGKLALCGGDICTCTATACLLTPPSTGALTPLTGPFTFDMQVSGASADGTVAGLPSTNQNINVHLTKG